MNKRENYCAADFLQVHGKSYAVPDLWKTRIRGTAVCANPNCKHVTGTIYGERPRTGREFDYGSSQIEKNVKEGRAAYCPDEACQKLQDIKRDAGKRAGKRKLEAIKKAAREMAKARASELLVGE